MTVKHIERPSLQQANALIDEINTEEELPKAAEESDHRGLGPHIDLTPATAWISNPIGSPPPGITLTWDIPLTHPTQPARFSVQVTDEQLTEYLIGRQPTGFPGPIQAQDAVERDSEWFLI